MADFSIEMKVDGLTSLLGGSHSHGDTAFPLRREAEEAPKLASGAPVDVELSSTAKILSDMVTLVRQRPEVDQDRVRRARRSVPTDRLVAAIIEDEKALASLFHEPAKVPVAFDRYKE